MKQIKFKLKNKLKVILIPSHKSPVVSVQMWVKTGSADEKKGEEGISHFIEHLVFKGTEKYKVGEIANLVEASGGELNAYTSFDQTVFYVTISKNYSEVALDVISEMMGHPLFDPAEVDSEREVVCEEIKMGQDSPQRSASQLLFSSVFKKHPYGVPVIGYEKNVRSWPVKKIKNFYQSRYVPSNMALVISGDFDPNEIKKKVVALYENFKPYKFKKIKRTKEPAQKKATISSKTKDLSESIFQIAFPVPNVKHKDIPALDVLAVILGQGESSRLFHRLRLEKPRVNTVSCYNYSPQDAGLFNIYLKYTDQNEKEMLYHLFLELEKMKTSVVAWEEIKKSIINLSSEQFYSIETVDGIAQKIGSSEFYMGDSSAHEKYLKQIQKITPQHIQAVAKKYFVFNKSNLSLMSKRIKAENEEVLKLAQEIWTQAVSENKKNKGAFKNKKIKIPKFEFKKLRSSKNKDLETITTGAGTKILFYNSTEIPTVSAKIVFGGGARLEQFEKMGTVELLSRTWGSQTKTKTEAQILQTIETNAAGINAFGGKNTCGFSIDYMKPFEKTILDLSKEMITENIFSDDYLSREKQILQKQIVSKEDQPSYLCGREFLRQLFPDHPLSYEQSGTLETITHITNADLQAIQKSLFKKQNMLVSVVGDFSKQRWLKKIEELEKLFQSTGRQLKALPIKKLTENKHSFIKKDKEQSHVIVGWQALSLTDPDRYALQIIQAIMAGQGGRLFIELRDKNSLAYSVSPIRMESVESGYFGGYIACSPDKVEKSLAMFDIEFKKICEQKISNEELQRAQKYLIGQHDIGLQRKSALCNLIAFDEFYGNDIHESLDVAQAYLKITAQDVLRVAQRIFEQPKVISVVGRE